MVASPVTITVTALSTVIASQHIGEPPLVIRPNPVWTDPDGDRVAEAAAWTELRQIGWVDRRGRLDGEALDSLHVLSASQHRVHGRVHGRGPSAQRGRRGPRR